MAETPITSFSIQTLSSWGILERGAMKAIREINLS